MKESEVTIRVGIALRPQDQRLISKLEKKLSTRLDPSPGTTRVIRASLEALAEREGVR